MLLQKHKELVEFLPLAELYTTYADHRRLTVFANKGRTCVSCGRIGTLLAVGRETTSGALHVDLYTDDFVLMTVDHVVPKKVCKAQGWDGKDTESLDNKQPMCEPCNNKKDSKVITVEQMRALRQTMFGTAYGAGIVRQLVPNIHALLGDGLRSV